MSETTGNGDVRFGIDALRKSDEPLPVLQGGSLMYQSSVGLFENGGGTYSIGAPRTRGTLGLVLSKTHQGHSHNILLSCSRAFFGEGEPARLGINLVGCPSSKKDDVAGVIKDRAVENYKGLVGVNCASAVIFPDRDTEVGLPMVKLLGVGGPESEKTVYYISGDETYSGRISGVDYTQAIGPESDPLKEQIVCEFLNAIDEDHHGAVVFAKDFSGDAQVIGLLWTSDINIGIVSPMQAVLDSLGLEFDAKSLYTTPWTRWMRPVDGRHVLRTKKEGRPLGEGWQSEGVMCDVLRSQKRGSIPVYQYYSYVYQDHYYTTDWFKWRNNGGETYLLENVPCYIFPTPRDGYTAPIYRFKKSGSSTPQHHYQMEGVRPPFWEFDDDGDGTNPDKAILGYAKAK